MVEQWEQKVLIGLSTHITYQDIVNNNVNHNKVTPSSLIVGICVSPTEITFSRIFLVTKSPSSVCCCTQWPANLKHGRADGVVERLCRIPKVSSGQIQDAERSARSWYRAHSNDL